MRRADELRKPIGREEDGRPTNGESLRAGPRAGGGGARSPRRQSLRVLGRRQQGRATARGEEGASFGWGSERGSYSE